MVVYALTAISPFPITDICMSHLFPPSLYFFFFSIWPNRKTVHVCTFRTCVHPFLAPWFAYANRHGSCCGSCPQALLLTAGTWRATVSNVTALTSTWLRGGGLGGPLGVTPHLPPRRKPSEERAVLVLREAPAHAARPLRSTGSYLALMRCGNAQTHVTRRL